MFSKADSYERFMGRWSRLLAPAVVRFSGVREGDAVLDVGSGTGALVASVREANKTGHITGVDASPEYVSYAAQQHRDPRIHFECADARQLTARQATFDHTLSALVLNFVPEPARAVREMMRVTKPGGGITSAVWDYSDGMQMLRAFWDEATSLEPSSSARDEAHMPLCREGELATLWEEQGLADVQQSALTVSLQFTCFEDYWGPFLLGQGPAGAYVASLPEQRRRRLEQRLRKRLGTDRSDQAIAMPARAWIVRGTVP